MIPRIARPKIETVLACQAALALLDPRPAVKTFDELPGQCR